MNTKSSNKAILSSFIIVIILAITFLAIFLFKFEFTKKIACLVHNENNFTYLIVDEKINDFLQQTKGTVKKAKLEFNQKTYSITCVKIKQFNDQFIYETNINLDLTSTNIGYFLVTNLNYYEFIN